MTETLIEIPARRGKAAFVAAGQTVTVINTHGEQVVDTWAFNRADLGEFMSNEHTRAHSLHLVRHLRRNSRHADRGLRPLPLRLSRSRELSRQLHG